MRIPGIASRRAPSIVVSLSLLMVACGGASPSSEARTTGASTPTAATPAPTPDSTLEPTPLPLPDHDLAVAQTWFSPNMGSIDFPELFSQPDRWATAREAVDVFAFSANAVSGDPFDIGGDNVLDTFVAVDAFASLHEWDIPIAIEGGAIKFFACDHASWAEYAIRGIDNVEAHGGRVSFFTMDEPLLGGQLLENGMACGYSIEETAVEVAEFVADVTAAHPAVRVGVVEPYPHISADELLAWLSALSDAGAAPAFFHLDVDMERVAVENHDVAGDLARLAAGSAAAGIPFGVILTSNWTQAGTDPGYVASTLEWAEVVRGAIGRPTHVVVQSWQGPAASGLHEVPINLPDEVGAVSHTRLLLDLLALFESDT